MIAKYQKKYSTWLDVSMPDKSEVDNISKEYSINPSIGYDLLNPTPNPKALSSLDKLYAVIHIPVFKHSHSKKEGEGNEQEIDFVIGRKFLISVRYDSIDALYKYSKETTVKEILEREEGGSHIFIEIMLEIYKSLFDELAFMEDRLKDIEKKIFAGKEKEMVFAISKTGRDLLNFRRIIEPHREILEELKKSGADILGRKFHEEIEGVIEEWRRLTKSAHNHSNFLDELREANNSLLSTKQNEIMKTLTIMAFVTFPLTLITSIFGMEMDNKPLVDEPGAFWIIIGMMGLLTVCFFIFFKYKKWL